VLGAGLVHGICIAALLPMLITVPAPVESNAGPHPFDVAGNAAEAARPARPAADQAPPLVTGSLAAPAAARANLLAKLPREELHPAAPVALRLASADMAEIVLADADPVVAGTLTAALEEIETGGAPPDLIKVIDTEAETPKAVARAEPSPPPSQSVQPKASAPPQKARAVQPRPRAKARGTAAAPRRQAAVPARTSTGPTARRPVQPRVRTAPPNLGLGLLFSGPARRQAVRR
jgi:hypothetical protein